MIVEVAAAVIQRADGAFLLAQRPAGKAYAGHWEFPGGKVEPGEATAQALSRELREELGIEPTLAYPWITREFSYAHAQVRLNFFRVVSWDSEPYPREGQALAWQRMEAPMVQPMLPANAPVLASLALPQQYAISQAAALGVAEMLRRLEERLEAGLRLLQIRETGLGEEDRGLFTRQAIALAHRYGCKVLTKEAFAGADGIHFTAAGLAALHERPQGMLAAASCHTRAELERAMALELDFAVVGPVRPTPSHDNSLPLGWAAFADLIRGASLPVYAIGGMTQNERLHAWRAGAHGVAMLSGAWR